MNRCVRQEKRVRFDCQFDVLSVQLRENFRGIPIVIDKMLEKNSKRKFEQEGDIESQKKARSVEDPSALLTSKLYEDTIEAIKTRKSPRYVFKIFMEADQEMLQRILQHPEALLLHAACDLQPKRYFCTVDHQLGAIVMKIIELYPNAIKTQDSRGFYPFDHAIYHRTLPESIVLYLLESNPMPYKQPRTFVYSTNNPHNEYNSALNVLLAEGPSKELPYYETVIKRLIKLCPISDLDEMIESIKLFRINRGKEREKITYRCALHLAILRKHKFSVVRLLVEAAPNFLHFQDDTGCTTLHLVCHRRNKKMLEYILDHEQKINVNTKEYKGGQTALHIACTRGFTFGVMILMGQPNIDVNAITNRGYTALHLACDEGNQEMLNYVIGCRENLHVNTREFKHGWTALHVACIRNFQSGIRTLLRVPNIDVNATDKRKMTPLHIAIKHDHRDIVSLLLKQPTTNVNALNSQGDSALHMACKFRSVFMVLLLLDCSDINVNATNNNYDTPLHVAIEQADPDLIGVLINDSRIDVNMKNIEGLTPLHEACSACFSEGVRLLLSRGDVDVNAKDHGNCSPLHHVFLEFWDHVKEGRLVEMDGFNIENTVQQLLNHRNISINDRNADEKTALEGFKESLAFLLDQEDTMLRRDAVPMHRRIIFLLEQFTTERRQKAFAFILEVFIGSQ